MQLKSTCGPRAILSRSTIKRVKHYASNSFNPPMARGEVDAIPPTGFSRFSREWEDLSLQTKFLAVGSALGYLSMKNFFKSDLLS